MISLIKNHKLKIVLGVSYVFLLIYFSLAPNPPEIDPTESDMFAHLTAYFILMLWFARIYPPNYYPLLGIGFISLGIALEIIQGFEGFRAFEYIDIAANSAGILLGWFVARYRFSPVRPKGILP
ncbi:MAG: hypothetical protein ACE5E9_03395 [Nitrospinaceae bacterium]